MAKPPLPDWAEAAIDSMGAEKLRPRLVRRWHEIEQDVLPHMDELNDFEKQQVLDCILWAGKYWQKTATDIHRDKLTAAQSKMIRIADDARTLSSKLWELIESAEVNDLHLDMPSLWESLEVAASYYPDWHHVMKAHGEWNRFMITAKTQSRPKPRMIDLLDAFADGIDGGCGAESVIGDALSRKRNADHIRVLLVQLRDNLAYPLLERGYRLPDQAIATLASIIFEIDPPPGASAIKQLRHRLKIDG